ncbi:MAG: VCBS repeat-containing protein [Gemmataceae bacterium]
MFRPQFGDWDGRGDLVSGSNCCRTDLVHLFARKKDGGFAERRDVRLKWPGPDRFGPFGPFGRAVTNPHLVDWDGDGRIDLVVGHSGQWTLYVGAGPLAGKTEVPVKPFALPAVADARPAYFGFADWDGDGRRDLLAGVAYQKGSDAARRENKGSSEPVSYGIYWFRNTAAKGAPRFAAARRLLTIPAPWELDAFAVVKGGDGRLDLVVSVSKSLRRKDGGFHVDSRLWLYRRKG